MASNKIQHYVPIVYLKGFSAAFPENQKMPLDRIYTFVYDKNEREHFRKGIKNIANSNYFYSFYRADGSIDHSIEKKLSHYESGFRKISKILFGDHIVNRYRDCELFEIEDARKAMAYYLSLQMRRVPKFREQTERDFRSSGIFKTEQDLQSWINFAMIDFGEGSHGYPPLHEIFVNKRWTLLCIHGGQRRYVTSDSPVSFFNGKPLIDPGSEIWFPINENILLQLYGDQGDSRVGFMDPGSKEHNLKIDEINSKIAQQAHRHIFSSNESTLKSIVKRTDLSKVYAYM